MVVIGVICLHSRLVHWIIFSCSLSISVPRQFTNPCMHVSLYSNFYLSSLFSCFHFFFYLLLVQVFFSSQRSKTRLSCIFHLGTKNDFVGHAVAGRIFFSAIVKEKYPGLVEQYRKTYCLSPFVKHSIVISKITVQVKYLLAEDFSKLTMTLNSGRHFYLEQIGLTVRFSATTVT